MGLNEQMSTVDSGQPVTWIDSTAPHAVIGTIPNQETHFPQRPILLAENTLSFFDKYLNNQDDHLLENPSAVYPQIINFQRK